MTLGYPYAPTQPMPPGAMPMGAAMQPGVDPMAGGSNPLMSALGTLALPAAGIYGARKFGPGLVSRVGGLGTSVLNSVGSNWWTTPLSRPTIGTATSAIPRMGAQLAPSGAASAVGNYGAINSALPAVGSRASQLGLLARSPAGASAAGLASGLGTQFLLDRFIDEKDGRLDNMLKMGLSGLVGGGTTGGLIGSGVFSIPGAAIGGTIGGLGGLATGFFTGGNTSETDRRNATREETERLEKRLRNGGINGEFRDQIMSEFRATIEAAGDQASPGAIRDLADQYGAATGQFRQAYRADQAMRADQQARQAAGAGMNEWLRNQISNQAATMNENAELAAQSIRHQAQGISDPYQRQMMEQQAARIPIDTASQIAYQMQAAAMAPAMYGYYSGYDQSGAPMTDPRSLSQAVPYDPYAVPTTYADEYGNPQAGMADPYTGQLTAPIDTTVPAGASGEEIWDRIQAAVGV